MMRATPRLQTEAPPPPVRVLFLDDEEVNRALMRAQLAPAGFDVTVAATGEEALAAFDLGEFEVVVLDVMMPQPDGIETCRRIVARGRAVPVLFVSGWPEVETRARAMAAGGSAFLPRPYHREHLVATLRALVGSQRT